MLIWQQLKPLGFKAAYDLSTIPVNGILAVSKSNIKASFLESELAKHNIIVRERLGKLRLSPHIYLTHEQIRGTTEIISNVI
ncbi:MAG: hypothetical protein JW841_16120 [Deltaproteobacteria bacterium]|nr:hypothetical protein [Deltaproteobacteria bacterium]